MSQPQVDPKNIAMQRAMMRLLNTPPETIISLLDRLEIPWDKKKNPKTGKVYLVIEWKDLAEGEQRLQKEGPFIKQVMEEVQKEIKELKES